MGGQDLHFEPYIHLVDVTHDSALIAWGGFYFRRRGERWELVDDEDLPERSRAGSIGAGSPPYGSARVSVRGQDGSVVASAACSDRNHVWVRGLSPDERYEFEIEVDGARWADGPLRDWDPTSKEGLVLRGSRYRNCFRTHPDAARGVPLDFAVLGDYGIGVSSCKPAAVRQRRVARALQLAVERSGVRLILTTGDNIYFSDDFASGGTGDEDDDWFFSFYQPYRYVINRVPVYPAVGNHDTGDTESSDDRQQLADNFFFAERFHEAGFIGDSSVDPGLLYRFRFGKWIEFICVDTSSAPELGTDRFMFEHPKHLAYLQQIFAARNGAARPLWRIPYSHHPPYCAGPHHHNLVPLVEHLVPLFKSHGVKLALSGHEHNFQYSCCDGLHYVVSGAAGQLREDSPLEFEAAHTVAWAKEEHFLLVTVDDQRILIRPIAGCSDEEQKLVDIRIHSPGGDPVPTPIQIAR